ncbi:MAG: hypothetical protein JST53_00880 [Actinobacteria bacterium]|nr:hypothetical protein [Actinomycetota bacterium]
MAFFDPSASMLTKILIAIVGAAIIVAMVLAVMHSEVPRDQVEALRVRSTQDGEGTAGQSFGEAWADRKERGGEEWSAEPGKQFAESWADR